MGVFQNSNHHHQWRTYNSPSLSSPQISHHNPTMLMFWYIATSFATLLLTMPLYQPHSLAAATLLLLSISSNTPPVSARRNRQEEKPRSYYDVLQIPHDASLQDIKKSYRKLAVQHHPDRNPGDEKMATIRFREVSEAYETLSDEKSRRQYDNLLQYGGVDYDGSSSEDMDFRNSRFPAGDVYRRSYDFKHRDPFAQFNDLFRNDPFFAEAFKSMDDLFDKTFSSFGSETDTMRWSEDKESRSVKTKAGFWSKLKNWLPSISYNSKFSSTHGDGKSSRTTHSSYSNSGSGRGFSTYTSRRTQTTIQNGKRVTTQYIEKDGNRIEEKYIDNTLVERKINGERQDVGRIGQGEF